MKAYKIGLHLFDSVVRDGMTNLLLCNCEVKPQLAPGVETVLRPDSRYAVRWVSEMRNKLAYLRRE